MRIFLVNEDVDLGYYVQKAFLDYDQAVVYAEELRKGNIEMNKHYSPYKIWIEAIEAMEVVE